MSGSRKQTSSERTEADTFNSKVKHVLYFKKTVLVGKWLFGAKRCVNDLRAESRMRHKLKFSELKYAFAMLKHSVKSETVECNLN